nr:STAS domain-containing protein [Tessaracoccus sp. OS52]
MTTQIHDDYAVIAVDGRLTATGAPLLRQAAADLVSTGNTRLVVDLGAASFVDSSGLGALINALKTARLAGGDLRIAAAPDHVRSVLRLTNLDRVLRNHPTAGSAFSDS